MPVNGVRRLRSTSTASAFSGDTYNTRVPAPAGRGSDEARRSMAHRNAASVLPEPVGAMTKRVVAVGDGRPRLRLGRGRLRERAREPVAGQPAEPGEGTGAHLAIVQETTDKYQGRAAAMASASASGIPGTRATASRMVCAHASATRPMSIDGSIIRCRHISRVKAIHP